jgi:acyl dehydratase
MTVHRSPERTLTAEDMATLIRLGGYVHPLFTDPAFLAASPFPARPVPGQALLLVMGGLAEQTDAYDDRTLALLGFDAVTFHRAAVDGDRIHVEVQSAEPDPAAERTTRWTWRAVRADGTLLVEATARFLMRR